MEIHRCCHVTLTASAFPDENVTLAAVPQPGYRFVRWTGDVSEIEDTRQSTILVHMKAYYAQDITTVQITANFEKTGLPIWVWLIAGAVAILVAATAAIVLLRRRKGKPADAKPA